VLFAVCCVVQWAAGSLAADSQQPDGRQNMAMKRDDCSLVGCLHFVVRGVEWVVSNHRDD
jgi:hypothetical protein